MKARLEWLNGRFQNLHPVKKALLWMLGTVFLIPPLFVIANPEGGSIILAFMGLPFLENIHGYIKKSHSQPWKATLLTGLVVIGAFVISTGLMMLFMWPICRWLEVQETIEIQFLNRERIYGLALCYRGSVDFITLGFGAFVYYLLWPAFYLIYLILSAPFRLWRS